MLKEGKRCQARHRCTGKVLFRWKKRRGQARFSPKFALANVSRVGVLAFIKSLSMEVAAYHITANTLAPGYILIELIKKMLENQCLRENITYDEALKRLQDKIPTRSNR